MTTIEGPHIRATWNVIKKYCAWSALAGIVGNQAHMVSPSYHNGHDHDVQAFGYGNYGLDFRDDRKVSKIARNDAAALDVSQKNGANDKLRVVIGRMIHAAKTNPKMLVEYGVREFAGPDDNGNVIAYSQVKTSRLQKPRFVRTYGWDDSHKTHIHVSIPRNRTRDKNIHKIARFFIGV